MMPTRQFLQAETILPPEERFLARHLADCMAESAGWRQSALDPSLWMGLRKTTLKARAHCLQW